MISTKASWQSGRSGCFVSASYTSGCSSWMNAIVYPIMFMRALLASPLASLSSASASASSSTGLPAPTAMCGSTTLKDAALCRMLWQVPTVGTVSVADEAMAATTRTIKTCIEFSRSRRGHASSLRDHTTSPIITASKLAAVSRGRSPETFVRLALARR